VFKSINGTVTTEFQQDISTDPRSVQLKTVGNNLQIRAYALAEAQGVPFASISYTTSNPIRTTTVGIIKNGNQASGQANNIDNFRAE
jgi:hypothetical protein